MKFLIILALSAVTLARPDDKQYDSKYDNFNIQELTNNSRLLRAYADCFLDKGKCTAEGTDIKGLLPEAVQTSCGKCTDKQKVLAATAIDAIKEKLPEEYKALLALYDQEGKHAAELDAFVIKYKS